MVMVMLSGCMSLTPAEKNSVYELKAYGVNVNEVKLKDPSTAAWLNVLPGVGYFYLAGGTEDRERLLNMGVFSLLTWPLSWFWGITGAYSDAEVLNKKDLVAFYELNPVGKEKLKSLKKTQRNDL